MENIDYIKERLNTLRIKFMAQILILIALGSGLSKMILDIVEKTAISNDYKIIFNVGLFVFVYFLINIAIDLNNLKKEEIILKDKKW